VEPSAGQCADLTGNYVPAERDSTTGSSLKFPMEYGSNVDVFEAFLGTGKLILTQAGCLLTARSENRQGSQDYNFGPEQTQLTVRGRREVFVSKRTFEGTEAGSNEKRDEATITIDSTGDLLVRGRTYTKICMNMPGFPRGCSEERQRYNNRFKRID